MILFFLQKRSVVSATEHLYVDIVLNLMFLPRKQKTTMMKTTRRMKKKGNWKGWDLGPQAEEREIMKVEACHQKEKKRKNDHECLQT